MTRSLLALITLLFSLTFTASEAPATRIVKAKALSQSELSVETVCTASQHTEKQFLPADELMLALVHAEYVSVSLFAPAHPTASPELNNRGPPTIPA